MDAFLMAGTRTGMLATVRADGRPHVAPVWFVLDGSDVVFNTGADTVKGRNLAREGRAALSVDDPHPPYAFVTLEGTVTLSDDETAEARAAKRTWATRIGARYMGADRAEAFGRRNAVPGEYLVRLTPTSRVGMVDVAE
jgi:PPOX class probable F420-dependent enzyme